MAREIQICPHCLGRKLKSYDTYHYGGVSKPRYRCIECGRLTIYPMILTVATRKKK